MKDKKQECWMDIYNRIATEQDPRRFTQLIQELLRLLDETNLQPRGKANKTSGQTDDIPNGTSHKTINPTELDAPISDDE